MAVAITCARLHVWAPPLDTERSQNGYGTQTGSQRLVAIIFGILVGLALGLTGGGGSILAVPLLIYGLQVAPKSAITLSLAVVALIALFGVVSAWRHRLLEVRAALIFAVAGMAAAPLGVLFGDYSDDRWLLMAFATLMLIVAGRMYIDALRHPEQAKVVRGDFESDSQQDSGTVCHYSRDGRLHLNAPCSFALIGMGLLTGVLSGLFGVGGGFVIVPALVYVTEMGIHRAVATSLLVITLVGASGALSGIFSERHLDWSLAGLFLTGGLIGMWLGRRLAQRLVSARLQQLFAVVLVLVGIYMLLQQGNIISPGAIR